MKSTELFFLIWQAPEHVLVKRPHCLEAKVKLETASNSRSGQEASGNPLSQRDYLRCRRQLLEEDRCKMEREPVKILYMFT